MRRIRGTTLVLVLAAAVGGIACGGAERRSVADPSSTTTTTSALTASSSVAPDPSTASTTRSYATPTPAPAPVEVPSAVMRVTMTRCDREAACHNVGTNRRFGDRDACANEVGHHVVGTLSTEECPSGVDADRLAACVSDLQSEPCTDKPAPAEGPSSCGRERLCARPSEIATSPPP